MKSTLFVVSIITILMAGCNGASERAVSATQTDNTPSDTATHMVTPTATTQPQIIRQCIKIEENEIALQEATHNGTVVIDIPGAYEPPYLLDLQTGVRYELPLTQKYSFMKINGMSVSPDGNHLLYLEIINDDNGEAIRERIWVVNAKGQVETSWTILSNTLFGPWRWLDNQNLEFTVKETKINGTVAIVNPFKKEWENITNDLPYFPQSYFFDIHRPWWAVDYNTGLDRVVYLGDMEGNGAYPFLWDINTEKVIWQFKDYLAMDVIPRWSPSGNEIAIYAGGDIHIIDQSGRIKLVPKLANKYIIREISWSPNGNYLAIEVSEESGLQYVMFYNVHSKIVMDYCVVHHSAPVLDSLWSADSQEYYYDPVLIDIKDESAVKILRDPYYILWMNSMP